MKSKKPKDLKASIVATSQQLTVEEAAKRHHCSTKTVIRYRNEALKDPELAKLALERRLAMQEKIADITQIALLRAYETVVQVLDAPDATNQDKLTAYKLITDRVSADSLAKTMLGLSDNVIENS